MWLVLLLACDPASAPTGGFTSETYAPPWAAHLMYRQLDPDDLASIDTGDTLSRIYHVGMTGADPSYELVFSEGDNYAPPPPGLKLPPQIGTVDANNFRIDRNRCY